jgi:hypothetical protein
MPMLTVPRAGCCARAEHEITTATPLTSLINSRLLIFVPCLEHGTLTPRRPLWIATAKRPSLVSFARSMFEMGHFRPRLRSLPAT